MTGLMRHRNDIVAKRIRADFIVHARHGGEHLHGFTMQLTQGGNVEFEIGIGVGDVIRQQLQALGFAQGMVIELVIHLFENLGNRVGVASGFLANIEVHQIKTKRFHQTNQVGQHQVSHVFVAVADE